MSREWGDGIRLVGCVPGAVQDSIILSRRISSRQLNLFRCTPPAGTSAKTKWPWRQQKACFDCNIILQMHNVRLAANRIILGNYSKHFGKHRREFRDTSFVKIEQEAQSHFLRVIRGVGKGCRIKGCFFKLLRQITVD
jgi:hypothetical protein